MDHYRLAYQTEDSDMLQAELDDSPHGSRPQKRYRRKTSELDKLYDCPIDNCGKRYGSMSALRLHLSMKHSLKRSRSGNLTPTAPPTGQATTAPSTQAELESPGALSNQRALTPTHELENDRLRVPTLGIGSTELDELLLGGGKLEAHSCMDLSSLHDKNLSKPSQPSQLGTRTSLLPAASPFSSTSCPDFFFGQGFQSFEELSVHPQMSLQYNSGVNRAHVTATPHRPFGSRGSSTQLRGSIDGLDQVMMDLAMDDDPIDVNEIVSIFERNNLPPPSTLPPLQPTMNVRPAHAKVPQPAVRLIRSQPVPHLRSSSLTHVQPQLGTAVSFNIGEGRGLNSSSAAELMNFMDTDLDLAIKGIAETVEAELRSPQPMASPLGAPLRSPSGTLTFPANNMGMGGWGAQPPVQQPNLNGSLNPHMGAVKSDPDLADDVAFQQQLDNLCWQAVFSTS